MPYLFFGPLVWWAMQDDIVLVALWMFAWLVLPTLLWQVYQIPVVKILVDTTLSIVRIVGHVDSDAPTAWVVEAVVLNKSIHEARHAS